MEAERWDRVKEILNAVLERGPNDRAHFFWVKPVKVMEHFGGRLRHCWRQNLRWETFWSVRFQEK